MARITLIGLALALAPAWLGAQPLSGHQLFPRSGYGTALHTVVLTVAPGLSADDPLVLSAQSWMQHRNIEMALPRGAQGAEVLMPVIAGIHDVNQITARYGGLSTPLVMEPQPRDERSVAAVGLPPVLVQTALRSVGVELSAAAVSVLGDDALVPSLVPAFGGLDGMVVSDTSLRALNPVSRAVLLDWVFSGGALIVLGDTASLAREPWWAPLAARTAHDAPWGTWYRHGLGTLGLMPLTLADYDAPPAGVIPEYARLSALARALGGAGRGLFAPGNLSLFERFTNQGYGAAFNLAEREDHRGPLTVVAGALLAYCIALGLWLKRNRAAKNPLRLFVELPVAAFAILTLSYAASRAGRSRENIARAFAVLDLSQGADRGYQRSFLWIRVGTSLTLAPQTPAGQVELYQPTSARGTTLRYDGQRLSTTRLRLASLEQAYGYHEGLVALGGTVRITRDDDATPRVTNQTAFTLSPGVVVSANGHRVYTVAGLAPGQSARGEALTRAQVLTNQEENLLNTLRGNAIIEMAPRLLGLPLARPGPTQYLAFSTDAARDTAARTHRMGITLREAVTLVRAVDDDGPALGETRADRDPEARLPPPVEVPATQAPATDAAVDARALLSLLGADAGAAAPPDGALP